MGHAFVRFSPKKATYAVQCSKNAAWDGLAEFGDHQNFWPGGAVCICPDGQQYFIVSHPTVDWGAFEPRCYGGRLDPNSIGSQPHQYAAGLDRRVFSVWCK